jgi:hypothetical protein
MRLSIRILLILWSLILAFSLIFPLHAGRIISITLLDPSETSTTAVYFDPTDLQDAALVPSTNITVELRIANVTDLYGFDIGANWNTSVLNYTSHAVKIPVETYPEGVLHEPNILIINHVNATTGTYQIVATSLSPANSFNGSGVVFEITFTVLSYGESVIEIDHSSLSNSKGSPISHTVGHSYFRNVFYDLAIVNVFPSSTSVFVGNQLNITVAALNNSTISLGSFNVTLNADNTTINTWTILGLPAKTETQLIFEWNTTEVTPGDYMIWANATTLNQEENYENNRFDDGIVTLVIEPIHEIAIIDFAPLKTIVFPENCFSVNVTVENRGNLPETFNITLYANNVEINQTQISLNKDESLNVTFAWNLVDAVEYEVYLLNVTADQLFGENYTGDNSFLYSDLAVVHPGDFDEDMDVDIFDIVMIASTYGYNRGDPSYNSNFDINCDNQIDIFDIITIASFYGYERQ